MISVYKNQNSKPEETEPEVPNIFKIQIKFQKLLFNFFGERKLLIASS